MEQQSCIYLPCGCSSFLAQRGGPKVGKTVVLLSGVLLPDSVNQSQQGLLIYLCSVSLPRPVLSAALGVGALSQALLVHLWALLVLKSLPCFSLLLLLCLFLD